MLTSWLLAALPLAILILLILGFRWTAARAGPAGWLAAALVAWLGFGANLDVLAVALGKAFFLALDVLLIVWAAYLLYQVVDEAGGVATLSSALPALTRDRGMQGLLIAWAFASFLPGVGGFGVPVVVTAPILLGLGFGPVVSVVAPSLGHAWSVTFGSLGSSFQALIAASGIPGPTMAMESALLLGVACLACGWMVLHAVGGRRSLLWVVVLMGAAMAGVQYALAVGGVWTIAGFGGGLAGLAVGFGLAVAAARRDRGDEHRPAVSARLIVLALAGYALLIVITLAVQFIPPLRSALGTVVLQATFPAVATARGVVTPAESGKAIVLLRHAGAILVYSAGLAFVILRRAGAIGAGAFGRIAGRTALGVLGSSLAIASMTSMVTIMDHAGMTDLLARGLAEVSGRAFPLMAPWIGALGAFVSGSNTSSNLLFGMLQRRTAEFLAIGAAWILAAQTAGGAIGSVLSPTKVSVGATSASAADQESLILRRILRYAAPLLLLLGILAALAVFGGAA